MASFGRKKAAPAPIPEAAPPVAPESAPEVEAAEPWIDPQTPGSGIRPRPSHDDEW